RSRIAARRTSFEQPSPTSCYAADTPANRRLSVSLRTHSDGAEERAAPSSHHSTKERHMATATQPFTGTYAIDPVHSTVQFAVTPLTVSTFRASFADVEGRLDADGDAIALEARALVESVSIVEPEEFREHIVHGSDFFDAEAHPAITFRSTRVDLSDDGTATV